MKTRFARPSRIARPTFALLATMATGAQVAHSQSLIQHLGAADPSSEGWTLQGPGIGVVVGPDYAVGGWGVVDNDGGPGSYRIYEHAVASTDLATLQSDGWVLSVIMQDNSLCCCDSASECVSFFDGITKYTMAFSNSHFWGAHACLLQSDVELAYCTIGPPYVGQDPLFWLPSGEAAPLPWGLNRVDLVWDPQTQLADLYVAGSASPAITGYAGNTLTSPHSGPGLAFGSMSDISEGAGIYALARLTLLHKRVYVDINATGAGTGIDWANAFTNLQDALATAGTLNPSTGLFPNEIWVAQGTYRPDLGGGQTAGSRAASFWLKSSVKVYGGFAGTETGVSQRNWHAHPTILSGDIGAVGNAADNSYHVVQASDVNASARLDGFTIEGGNANAGPNPSDFGGGCYIYTSQPTIANCTVQSNSATSGGGGLFLWGSQPLVTNCVIRLNSSTLRTGGAFEVWGSGATSGPIIDGCSVELNTAYTQGGALHFLTSDMYSVHYPFGPILTHSSFTNNTAGNPTSGGTGGALHLYNSNLAQTAVNIEIDHCTFVANAARNQGGAVFLDGAFGGTVIRNSTFLGNTAPYGYGGGVASGRIPASSALIPPDSIENCLFANNSAYTSGAVRGGSIALKGCTIVQNSAFSGGGVYSYNPQQGSPLTVINSIVAGNTGGVGQAQQIGADVNCATPVASYSLVQGGYPGTGNINGLPVFIDAPGGNWRLSPGSQGIDSGNGLSVLPSATDLDGLPRQVDDCAAADTGVGSPVVDMGAYEVQGSPSLAYCTAGTTTHGCTATLSSSGNPSASANSGFVLTVSQVEGQKAVLFFYGVGGREALVWKAGSTSFLCVKVPVQRMASSNSGGMLNACDGSFSIDWNTFMSTHLTALGQPPVVGQVVDVQAYFRDPPAPAGTNLSNGLEFSVCP